jgi:hypothetical protein
MSERQPSRARVYTLAATRLVGGLALLATGGIHLEQYIVADYRVIPTIGSLFLLNFIAGTVLGLYFLVPARASVGPVRRWIDLLAGLSGLAVGLLGLIALEVSEHTPLFGFMEQGYRRDIVISIVAEGVTVVALGAFLVLCSKPTLRRDRGDQRPELRVVPLPAGRAERS